jgi:hypothetical protein
MAEYKPSFPFNAAIELLTPTYSSVKGVQVKTFPDSGIRLNCSFKTYGGTEITTNGTFTVIDTAIVETWYRPDIKSDCRIKLLLTGQVYEIIGKLENVNQRNQFLKFKVSAVEGGA